MPSMSCGHLTCRGAAVIDRRQVARTFPFLVSRRIDVDRSLPPAAGPPFRRNHGDSPRSAAPRSGWPGLPAGWLSGAIVAVSAAALAGRQVFVPTQLGHVVYVLLGISLGSAVTPETVATMVTWPLSMLALTIAMVAVTTSVMAYLKFVHGWDTLSALFAAAPGALAQAMALAQDTGADVRAIAMVQTVRLFILAVALPVAFAAFGVAGLPPPRGADAPLLRSIVELAVLIAGLRGRRMARRIASAFRAG